jgi:hypothetical protein
LHRHRLRLLLNRWSRLPLEIVATE